MWGVIYASAKLPSMRSHASAGGSWFEIEIAGLPPAAVGLQFPHISPAPCIDIRVVTCEIGLQPRESPHAVPPQRG